MSNNAFVMSSPNDYSQCHQTPDAKAEKTPLSDAVPPVKKETEKDNDSFDTAHTPLLQFK